MWKAAILDSCIGQIINLGGIDHHSINKAAEIVLSATGTDLKPIYLEKRYEVKHAWATWEKSSNLLDFEHKIDLTEGITKMWNWAKIQPNRDRFAWSEFEIDKNLYSYWKKK